MSDFGDLSMLAAQMNSIYVNAYYQAVPDVILACWKKDVSRDRLEHLFDSLLDFGDDENFATAFQFLAATYAEIYPETVKTYLQIYHDDWEVDVCY